MEKTPKAADVSRTSEREQNAGRDDTFPPEGTDEKILDGITPRKPLTEAERVAATRDAIRKTRTL